MLIIACILVKLLLTHQTLFLLFEMILSENKKTLSEVNIENKIKNQQFNLAGF